MKKTKSPHRHPSTGQTGQIRRPGKMQIDILNEKNTHVPLYCLKGKNLGPKPHAPRDRITYLTSPGIIVSPAT